MISASASNSLSGAYRNTSLVKELDTSPLPGFNLAAADLSLSPVSLSTSVIEVEEDWIFLDISLILASVASLLPTD